MNSTKFVCTHMLAQSACDALFSETVGTEFFCPPCEFFALVFQSQQKFQATITKKTVRLFLYTLRVRTHVGTKRL